MFLISPPFGNYISLPNTVSIRGSYTVEPRPGLIGQIVRTLRYSSEYRGWLNKIGLRNKGLDWAIQNPSNKITSIAITDPTDIDKIVEKVPDNMDIELNISCPNITKSTIEYDLTRLVNSKRNWQIIKLPHTDKDRTLELVDYYQKQGFKQFHISNTKSTPKGALSGTSLITANVWNIFAAKSNYPDLDFIGGGGVRDRECAIAYHLAGATYLSVSTLLFNPIKFYRFYKEYTIAN